MSTSTPRSKHKEILSLPIRFRFLQGLLLVDMRAIDEKRNQWWICIDPKRAKVVSESFAPHDVESAPWVTYVEKES